MDISDKSYQFLETCRQRVLEGYWKGDILAVEVIALVTAAQTHEPSGTKGDAVILAKIDNAVDAWREANPE